MGMFWQFFSFETSMWEALFNGGVPCAERWFAVVEMQSEVDAEPPDFEQAPEAYRDFYWDAAPPAVRARCERMVRTRLSYTGLDEAEAARQDKSFTDFFCAEGLWPVLHYSEEHQMGVAMAAMRELLERSGDIRVGGFFGLGACTSPGHPVSLAHALVEGRRLGTAAPTSRESPYFVLAAAQVPELLREVNGLLAVDRAWKTPEFRKAIIDELVPALERTAKAGRMIAGRWT